MDMTRQKAPTTDIESNKVATPWHPKQGLRATNWLERNMGESWGKKK